MAIYERECSFRIGPIDIGRVGFQIDSGELIFVESGSNWTIATGVTIESPDKVTVRPFGGRVFINQRELVGNVINKDPFTRRRLIWKAK